MKYKKVRKFSIIAVMIIVTIVSTTINSDSALAVPQATNASGNAILTISNIVLADCSVDRWVENGYCPQGSNSGMVTTITLLNHPQTPAINFPVGPWGANPGQMGATVTKQFEIPIGSSYLITTKIPTPNVGIIGGGGTATGHFYYIRTFFHGSCEGRLCLEEMGPNGAKVDVNYHWGREGPHD